MSEIKELKTEFAGTSVHYMVSLEIDGKKQVFRVDRYNTNNALKMDFPWIITDGSGKEVLDGEIADAAVAAVKKHIEDWGDPEKRWENIYDG